MAGLASRGSIRVGRPWGAGSAVWGGVIGQLRNPLLGLRGRPWINLACVCSLEDAADRTVLTLTDGENVRGYGRIRAGVLGRMIVPAQAGFTCLCWIDADPDRDVEELMIERTSVIAWAIDITGSDDIAALPVTAEGAPTTGDFWGWAVLQPDGTVVESGENIYQGFDKWSAVLKRRRRKRRQAIHIIATAEREVSNGHRPQQAAADRANSPAGYEKT